MRMAHHGGDHGPLNLRHMPAHVTSKAVLIRWSELLASDLLPHGVAVFAVQPGTVRTALAKTCYLHPTASSGFPGFARSSNPKYSKDSCGTFEPTDINS